MLLAQQQQEHNQSQQQQHKQQNTTNGPKKRKSEERDKEVKEETVEEDGLYYGELENDHVDYNEVTLDTRYYSTNLNYCRVLIIYHFKDYIYSLTLKFQLAGSIKPLFCNNIVNGNVLKRNGANCQII